MRSLQEHIQHSCLGNRLVPLVTKRQYLYTCTNVLNQLFVSSYCHQIRYIIAGFQVRNDTNVISQSFCIQVSTFLIHSEGLSLRTCFDYAFSKMHTDCPAHLKSYRSSFLLGLYPQKYLAAWLCTLIHLCGSH